MLCFHPQVFLRKGVTASRSYQEQTGKSGSFGLWHHPRGYVSNFLVRPASSLGALERSGTPSRHSRGIDTPVTIMRGGAQMKWFREPRCSFRVRPVGRGILRLHQPMDCSPPGSSVHGIFQARVLQIAVLSGGAATKSIPAMQTRSCCLLIPEITHEPENTVQE